MAIAILLRVKSILRMEERSNAKSLGFLNTLLTSSQPTLKAALKLCQFEFGFYDL